MLESIIEDLSVFKRALRGEDKVSFDSLMNKARVHAVTPMLEPMDAVFLSNSTISNLLHIEIFSY